MPISFQTYRTIKRTLALGEHKSPDGSRRFVIHRLNQNGIPDTTFDYDGADGAWNSGIVGVQIVLQPAGRDASDKRSSNSLSIGAFGGCLDAPLD